IRELPYHQRVAEPLQREFRLPGPVDLGLTLGPLRRGAADPCLRIAGRSVWRATRTPDGPATVELVTEPSTGAVRVRAWGPGAGWAVGAAAALVGAGDDEEGFVARHPIV